MTSSASVAPLGSRPPPAPWAATASAAVSEPVAPPRTRSTGPDADGRMSDQAEAGHQVGVDAVELFGDGGMGRTTLRQWHVLRCGDGGRQIAETVGDRRR